MRYPGDVEPGPGERVIQVETVVVWFGRDGVLREVVRPNTLFTPASARAALDAMRELTGGRPAPLVADLPKYANADPETRRFWGGPEVSGMLTALALVVHSPVMRVVGSFFVKMSGAPYPVDLFREEAEAVRWAKGHVRR